MLEHEVEWPVKKVTFISQAETERLEPAAGAAMISITDPDKPSASLGLWEPLDRNSFYDGGYSGNTIRTMKAAFRMNYVSCIDSSRAERLSSFLNRLAGSCVDHIFVYCYYGESRSGAVALYLQNKHGFIAHKPITKPNRTVYELLCVPTKYELLIQGHEAQYIDEEIPIHIKIWDFLLVVVGLRR
ncbi:hypothetical protein FXQ12_24440 [Salmonella enterica]|nr:hypothetical protein [Salmonella enterica]ECC9415214.1 hypothetical protein [Salmonella enterica subsp. enterica]EHF1448766.1 hypothetical protein [Salmonella enterica subsp. enterica serovar 4,5,12:b:-]EHG1528758.1 hypothetical protein [Salmonella enterica subsp. enterica serovar 4,[5],12:b:-]ECD8848696.1 hypothetical protein [Salmonella enterica subsp. enterica]